MSSMEVAIDNMIAEVKKPVDPEAGGSARKKLSFNQLNKPPSTAKSY
jgi:hypothetical protein